MLTVLQLLAVSITTTIAVTVPRDGGKNLDLFEKRDQSQWSDLIGHKLKGMQHAESNIGKRQSGTYGTATVFPKHTTAMDGSYQILPGHDGSTMIKLYNKENNLINVHDADGFVPYGSGSVSYRADKRNANLNDVIYAHYSKHMHPDDIGKRSTSSPDISFAEWLREKIADKDMHNENIRNILNKA